MNESIQRFGFLAGAQPSCFIGIMFSYFTGVLLVGAPLGLVVYKLIGVQPELLYQFISWLLLFGGGALLAAVATTVHSMNPQKRTEAPLSSCVLRA